MHKKGRGTIIKKQECVFCVADYPDPLGNSMENSLLLRDSVLCDQHSCRGALNLAVNRFVLKVAREHDEPDYDTFRNALLTRMYGRPLHLSVRKTCFIVSKKSFATMKRQALGLPLFNQGNMSAHWYINVSA